MDGVFALVASFEPRGDTTNELLQRSEVPLIGPITLSPHLSLPPNRYVFYLLSSFTDQARVLVDFVKSRTEGRPASLALIYAQTDFNVDALTGLRSQAKMYAMNIVAELSFDAGHLFDARPAEALSDKRPDYIFFFGGPDDLITLARELGRRKLNVPLLSCAVMIGRVAFDLPEDIAKQAFLAYPMAMPSQNALAEFIQVMQKSNVRLRNSAFQRAAFAAAKILVEATKRSSRQLSRAELLSALEQLRDFQTGVLPPVTFGPNRRVGTAGAYMVGVDLRNKQYVPLSDWILPKEYPE